MSVFSQDGNDDQLLSTFQVDSSNLGDPPNSVDSGNPLISADDTDGVVDENDPTTDFSDRPTEFASVDVAEQENPACGSNLATREEGDFVLDFGLSITDLMESLSRQTRTMPHEPAHSRRR